MTNGALGSCGQGAGGLGERGPMRIAMVILRGLKPVVVVTLDQTFL